MATINNTGISYKPSEEDRNQVSEMTSSGITAASIARYLQISETTLFKHYKYELETARESTVNAVASTLVDKALSGDTISCIFYLKTQGKWSETHKVEHTGSVAHNHFVKLPEPTTRENWLDRQQSGTEEIEFDDSRIVEAITLPTEETTD